MLNRILNLSRLSTQICAAVCKSARVRSTRRAVMGAVAIVGLFLVTSAEVCQGGGAECAVASAMIQGTCNTPRPPGTPDDVWNALVDQCKASQLEYQANCGF